MDVPKLQAIPQKLSLNCRGRLVMLHKPVVMGILNITPDSFFSGSRMQGEDQLIEKAATMLAEGAVFLDMGGYSTRPGASDVSFDEEAERIIPAIAKVHQAFPDALISVDTFRAGIAKMAVEAGASLVNDVSSGDDDPEMISAVAALGVPYIMMHKKGTPQTMQHNPQYTDIVFEVLQYFNNKISEAKKAGITDLVIDPGFGFGKTFAHNYELLNRLDDLRITGLPVLAGISRKKMIQHVTQTDAGGALNGTTAANTIAILRGASILRVHDVKQAIESINIVSATYGIS